MTSKTYRIGYFTALLALVAADFSFSESATAQILDPILKPIENIFNGGSQQSNPANNYQAQVRQEFDRDYQCVTTDQYPKAQYDAFPAGYFTGTIVKQLALQLTPCMLQNGINFNPVDLLLSVGFTSRNVNDAVVVVVYAGRKSQTASSNSQQASKIPNGVVLNEPPTNEKPPRAVVEQLPNERQPISSIEVYTPNSKFDPAVKNTIDASSSIENMTDSQDKEIPPSASYESWLDFFREASPKAVAFQPVSSITESGSQNLSPPKSVGSSTWTIEKTTAENSPVLGRSKPGAFIDSVYIDHNLSFDQKTKGMAITITSFVWNSKDTLGSINVYVKRSDGNYVQSRNLGYATRGQGLLTSGVKVKVPSNNTRVNTVVYLPYSAFDLPSGKTSDLRLQVQVQLDNSSGTLASDESQRFDIAIQTKVQQPPQFLLSSIPKGTRAVAFLINGYYGHDIPDAVKIVLETPFGAIPPDSVNGLDLNTLKLSNGQNIKGLGVHTIVGNWDNLLSQSEGVTIRSDTKFRNQMDDVLRQIEPGISVIFIGHSFGADSLMQVARCEAGKESDCTIAKNRIPANPKDPQGKKILFFATLDPVMAGGVRMRRSIPFNVRYLFNRWTENSVIPGGYTSPFRIPGVPVGLGIPQDHGINGQLSADFVPGVNASFNNDQDEQSLARNWDGKEIRDPCEWYEVCPGKRLPTLTRKGSNGTQARRVNHGGLPDDHYVQRQIIEALTKLLSNQSPVANNDTAAASRGSVTVNVLANDSDPDGDTLTVTNVTNGTYGEAKISSNGTVIYSLQEAFIQLPESDSFTYTISDGKGGNAKATVTVKLRERNSGPPLTGNQTPPSSNKPPVANNDTTNVSSYSSVGINVLANDTDPDGDSLTVTNVTQGSKGSVVISRRNGIVTYSPNPGVFNTTDTFTYTISDGKGGTASATVTVTIGG